MIFYKRPTVIKNFQEEQKEARQISLLSMIQYNQKLPKNQSELCIINRTEFAVQNFLNLFLKCCRSTY